MDKDIQLKLIELAGGLISLCSAAVITTRYWFHCRAREAEERAKVFGALADRFGKDVERLNMVTHDIGVRVDDNSRSSAELSGKMSILQPEVEELRKAIPPLLDLMNKVQAFFERKYPSSVVKPIAEDVVRVEEIPQTKKESKK